ncbi:MAG TPA: hypothetical protein VFW40_01400 [Capsulimonadaceae bacterium]|nr:hypothetical protein [Capsulimonadaceae bacterium]
MIEAETSDIIFLPLPPAFQKYLVGKFNRLQVLILVLSLSAILVAVLDIRAARFEVWHLSFILVGLIAWRQEIQRPRHHVIDKYGMNIYDFSKASHLKSTFIRWRCDEVLSIHPTSWSDLPALTVEVAIGGRRDKRSVLLLVHRPEDVEIVNNQAMPLIERYRANYIKDNRLGPWAERL